MRFASIELEINRYMEIIDIVVTNLDSMDIFLGYD